MNSDYFQMRDQRLTRTPNQCDEAITLFTIMTKRCVLVWHINSVRDFNAGKNYSIIKGTSIEERMLLNKRKHNSFSVLSQLMIEINQFKKSFSGSASIVFLIRMP